MLPPSMGPDGGEASGFTVLFKKIRKYIPDINNKNYKMFF
jgi:hypothetical protein